MTMRYAVIYEKTSNGFSAYVPDLPGVGVAGASREQTRELLRKAVAWHLEAMAAGGVPIPAPTTGAEELELGPEAAYPTISTQIKAAEAVMKKRRGVLRELAK